MADAPIGFQLHALVAFGLFALWPFTRLVHVFSAPLGYLTRPYIVYRSRDDPARIAPPAPRMGPGGMMHRYSGCRQIPLIRDYIAEHELVTWLGVRALEETGRGEMTKAQATVTQMRLRAPRPTGRARRRASSPSCGATSSTASTSTR